MEQSVTRLILLQRLAKRLSEQGQVPVLCYEAGCCGYGIHRLLTKFGYECNVVSPAMIPRKPGDHIKTDRRDAEMLARLLRAGELTAIWTPNEEHEAMRDLIRVRKQTLDALKVAKQQLLSFLLRHGLRYDRPGRWTKGHWRWINELRRFNYPHQQTAFEELKHAIRHAEDRLTTLNKTIEEAISVWRFRPVVDALRVFRGIDTLIAVTLVTEIGDISRFSNPRQLMAWLGLVPSERSSGGTVRRGRLTRTGNDLARTMLVEASWSYRHSAREAYHYLKRAAHLPEEIRSIGWKAQVRLCKRYRDLTRTGKPQPRVLAAIARELSGFVWDVSRKVSLAA